MKGTPTLGKAKSLKEKRELAAELGELLLLLTFGEEWDMGCTDGLDDVREFEAKRGLADRRASRSAAKKSGLKGDDNSEAEDEDDEEDGDGDDAGAVPDPKEVSPASGLALLIFIVSGAGLTVIVGTGIYHGFSR